VNVQKRWVAYCSGNTRDTTEDEWNNFVLKIFFDWRQQQITLDTSAPKKAGKSLTEYADAYYSFAKFIEEAETYQELARLELKRHKPSTKAPSL
jgi:hypothetical protein